MQPYHYNLDYHMEIFLTARLTDRQKEQICRLWNREYPQQISYPTLADFDAYLEKLSGARHFLLPAAAGQIAGWASTFVRDDDTWFALLLDASIQGKGRGTGLLNHLQQQEPVLNGWVADHDRYLKQNGQPYRSPLRFYLKNGFMLLPGTRLELAHLSLVKIRWERTPG